MKHLGDITKISGYTAPVVDVVIGGSPCQDLSVAGKRAGLDGERSGLFMEQIRIIKEMRDRDKRDGRSGVDVRPRYMVWENVPGAFSSNRGEDFRIVLEETAKVADKNAVIPRPADGKWQTSGCIVGKGYSIAWRVLDAQFWGVPQRRRRIALAADFGGESAPEILFVRESVSGDIEPGEPKREAASSDAERSVGADDRSGIGLDLYNFAVTGDKAVTINANSGASVGHAGPTVMLFENHGQDARYKGPLEVSPMLPAQLGTGGNNTPLAVQAYREGSFADYVEGTPRTLKSSGGALGGGSETLVCYALDQQGGKGGANYAEEVCPTICSDSHGTPHAVCYSTAHGSFHTKAEEGKCATLKASDYKDPPLVCYGIGSYHSNAWKSDNPYSGVYETDVAKTLDALNCGYPGCNQGGTAVVLAVDARNATEDPVNGALQSNSAHSLNGNNVVRTRYIVRRLTPLECERLQGYPDNWTMIGDVVGYERQVDENTGEEFVQAIYEYIDESGKKRKTSDAARYKALGNSIALPPWKWVLKRLCACYERDATMASLFDGIGGFPYIWEQLNGKGSCLWASEIEEFPIAVAKVRIGE